MYKGAIFDLDGTLLDSMGVWERIDYEFLGKRGFEVPEDYVDTITAMSFEETAIYTIERFQLPETKEAIMQEWIQMAIDAYSNDVVTKPGVQEYLKYLKERGIQMCVATASGLELVVPALKHNRIYEYFDNITTLKEVSRGKGYPDIYELAAKKMGLLPEECVVFEDIPAGIKGAGSGGFATVGVYDKRSGKDQDTIKELANAYILDFTNCEFPPAFLTADEKETGK